MDLIERYIDEVGRHLPEKGRNDIQAEIRSSVQDMLDDRAAQAGKAPDEAMVVEVLKAYGSPEKVAASYRPDQYLIGPRLYPAFLKTVRIVLPVLLALWTVGFAVDLARTPLSAGTIAATIAEQIGEMVASLVTGLGVVVLIYAILERTATDLREKPRAWDPRDLYRQKPADRVSPGEPISTVVFTLAAMAIFNLFPRLVGVYWMTGDQTQFLPVLSDVFWSFLPVLNLLWISQIVLNLGLVYAGRWTDWTRWLSIAVHGLEIGVASAMLAAGSLIGLTPEQIAANSAVSLESAQTLVILLNQMTRVALVLTIVLGVFAVARAVLRLVRGREVPVLVSR